MNLENAMHVTALEWNDYPGASESKALGRFLKVRLACGAWLAAVDGEYVTPRFIFVDREQAKTACEDAAKGVASDPE